MIEVPPPGLSRKDAVAIRQLAVNAGRHVGSSQTSAAMIASSGL